MKVSIACLSILVIFGWSVTAFSSASVYPVETTPVSRLMSAVKSSGEIRGLCEEFLQKRQTDLAQQHLLAPDNVNTRDMMNRYSGVATGKPRLIFNIHGTGTWWVPVVRNGEIGGFVKYSGRDGMLKSTPMWREGGAPLYAIRESDWNELPRIVADTFSPADVPEGRLIAISKGRGFQLYYCFPRKNGDVMRIDVTSLPDDDGFRPVKMNETPRPVHASCFEPDDEATIMPLKPSRNPAPETFSVSVLTPIKDQSQFGSCTGHAASTVFDWWTCGNVCYLGTGDSRDYSCICDKDEYGACECVFNTSRQWFYDRFRVRGSSDCRVNCPGFSCPGDGEECLESLVTSGVMCGIECICEGASPHHSTYVFVNEGGCTEECQPYGCNPGCTDGGSELCTGDCPNVDGPCGDDFKLATSFSIAKEETTYTALAIYRYGELLTSGNVCECWWAGAGCLCDRVCGCAPEGGHAYAYFGYSETEPTHRFYFQNSWGTTWGDGGRGELSYGFHACGPHGGTAYGFTGHGPGAPVVHYLSHEFDDSAGNDNDRPDPGETVDMTITVRNIGIDSSALTAALSTDDPDLITITTPEVSFPEILHNEEAGSSTPFTFEVDPTLEPHWVWFYFDFEEGGSDCGRDSVEVMVGRPALLFVDDDDGETYDTWYALDLDSLLSRVYDSWSVETQGAVTFDELSYYDAVIWFTGLSTETIGSDTTNLRDYLSGGGNLFLSGQNVGADIGETAFYRDVIHAEFITDNCAQYVVVGEDGDVLGDGLTLITSGSGGANNCYSPSEILPVSPAVTSFKYYTGDNSAIIRYENVGGGEYRVVYCATSFEAINARGSRLELLGRILGWLGLPVGVNVTGFSAREEEDGVLLSWSYLPSAVKGFNIYRMVENSGGSFERLNGDLLRGIDRYRDTGVARGRTYLYRLGAIENETETYYGPLTVKFSGGVGMLPERFALGQNCPNPFNPTTVITYEIPAVDGENAAVPVNIRIFDVKGQLVKILFDGRVGPGRYQIVWNGKNEHGSTLPSGIYYYRLEAAKYVESRKMVILK